jgi:O-antigen/teichoic acid export membrane protein
LSVPPPQDVAEAVSDRVNPKDGGQAHPIDPVQSIPSRIVVRDAALVAPGYIVPGLVSLATVTILFSTLGSSEYGLWALMFAIASGVPLLTTSAAEGLILRYQHRSVGRPSRAHWLGALGGTVVVAAVLAAVLLPEPSAPNVAATSLLSLSVATYLLRIAQLRAEMRFGVSSAFASLRAITGGVLAAMAAVVTRSADAVAVGMAIGFVVALGVTSFRDPARSDPSTAPSESPAHTSRLSYGTASFVIAVALFILSVGDRFILSVIRPLAEVGVYAAVYSVVDLVIRLGPAVLAVALRPHVFRAWDRREAPASTRRLGGIAALMLWGSCAVSLGLVIVANAISLGGQGHQLVGPIAIGISAAAVAAAISFVYSASERQVRLAVHVAACAALNIALNLILDPIMGANGAAAATAISFGALLAAHVLGIGGQIFPARDERALWTSSVSAGILVAISPAVEQEVTLAIAILFLTLGLVPVWRIANDLWRTPVRAAQPS